MAAVAPAQYEAHTVNHEYSSLRYDAETTGDESLKARLALEQSVRINNQDEAGMLAVDSQVGSGEMENRENGAETGAGVKYLSNGEIQGDDATAEEELANAEKDSAKTNDGSDKLFGEDDSVIAEEWEGRSEAANKLEVEVATRNNCMLVFSHFSHLLFILLSVFPMLMGTQILFSR